MAQITVCDVCGKQPAKTLTVPVGDAFNGVERETEYLHRDLCLDHALMIARCTLTCFVQEADREKAVTSPREGWMK